MYVQWLSLEYKRQRHDLLSFDLGRICALASRHHPRINVQYLHAI